jgi:hypothetical protein
MKFEIDDNFKTFLFTGWHEDEQFKIKIKSTDQESAIANFETTYTNHKWYLVEEI